MHSVSPCSEVITQVLSIKKRGPTQTLEAAIAQDMLKDLSSKDSTWRKPLKTGLLERIWRPIRNLICTKAYCEYDDIKNNLKTLSEELATPREIRFEVHTLDEQTQLDRISDHAKGAVRLYTSSLEKAAKLSHVLDEKKKNALLAMIVEVNAVLAKKKLDTALPKELQQLYDQVQSLQGALSATDPPLVQISQAIATLKNSTQTLSGYENSLLQQELCYTESLLKIKQELQAVKLETSNIPFDDKALETLTSRKLAAEANVLTTAEFRQLPPQKRQQLTSEFSIALTETVATSYRSMLDAYKTNAKSEISASKNSPQALAKVADSIWKKVSGALQELDSTEFGRLLKPAVQSQFEELSAVLGKELFRSQVVSLDVKGVLTSDRLELTKKIQQKTVTAEELATAQQTVNHLLSNLEMAHTSSLEVQENLRKMPPGQKSHFIQDTLNQLAAENKEYISLLQGYQKTIDSGRELVVGIVNARTHALGALAAQGQVVDARTYSNITAASEQAKWVPAMAQIAGWTTGTRDLVQMAGITETTASKLIGAGSTFVIYAMSGYCSGKLGVLGSLAYGGGAVMLSFALPTLKKAVKIPVVTHLSGPLVMAAYGLYGPTLLGAITTQGPSAQDVLKERALNLTKEAQMHSQSIEEGLNGIQNSTNKAIEGIHNATQHNAQGLQEIGNIQRHVQAANTSIDATKSHIDNVITYGTEAGNQAVVREAELARQTALQAQDTLNQAQAAAKSATQEIHAVKQSLDTVQDALVHTKGQLNSSQTHNTQLQDTLGTLKHTLNQIQNPQRTGWRILWDVAKGSAGMAAGGVTSIFIDPVSGGSLMAWGASTMAGHGYDGTN